METPTLKQLSALLNKSNVQLLPKRNVFLRKLCAGSLFFVMDISTLALSMIIALGLRGLIFDGEVNFTKYLSIMPIVLTVFPLTFYLRGLYPGYGIDVIDELRTMTYSTTIVYAVIAAMTFLFKGDTWDYSRIIFIMSWTFSMPMVPLGRALIRKLFGSKNWWGIPVIIIGAGKAGEKVIKSLQKHSHIGLRPIVALDDDVDRWGYIHKIPVIGGLEIVPELARNLNIDHAIIAMPGVPRKRQQEIVHEYSRYFAHTTVIPDLFGLSSLWVSTRNLGGILGLEVQQRLLKKSSLVKKRIFDLVISIGLTLAALPLFLIISTLIFLDSRGRIFFRQQRMGINDTRFSILKFRTMHRDAEKRLTDLLNQNPELRAEYDIYHKLRNDPRLTRIGKFLRKFSMDELPQFWNVVKGEMSLIGPRAYMPWEKFKMNGYEEMILKVKPGISGLWQVTDRNESSFEERNITDVYYIRNWSMFLDIYILARTISVVVLGRGAY